VQLKTAKKTDSVYKQSGYKQNIQQALESKHLRQQVVDSQKSLKYELFSPGHVT